MNLKNACKSLFALLVISMTCVSFAQQQQDDRIKYVLVKAAQPTADQLARYEKYDRNMREIVQLYNEHAKNIKGVTIRVRDGGPNGRPFAWLNTIVVYGDSGLYAYMHEVNHALGMAASPYYRSMVKNRKFYGPAATKLVRELTGEPDKLLTSDHHAFWPFSVNRPGEAITLERRINAVKMMDSVWLDLENRDMWTSRQIKSTAGHCLYVDPASLNVLSEKCRDSAEHAWDMSTISGTRSHRIKDVSTQGCLVVKTGASGPALAVEACAADEAAEGMWELGRGSEIRSVSLPHMCVLTTAAKEMGLGACPRPRTTQEILFRNGADSGYCMNAITTTPQDKTRFATVDVQRCVNSVARQAWRLEGNLVKFGAGDLCLQSGGDKAAAGSGLHTWPCDSSRNNLGGRFFQNDKNQLELVGEPGICVGVRGGQVEHGAHLELQTCNSNTTQTWFDHVELRSGLDSNYCMTADIQSGALADQVVSVIFSQCRRFAEKQKWRLESDFIRVGKSGTMCLQTSNNEVSAGTTLHTWPCYLSSGGAGGRYFMNDRHQIEMKNKPGMCVAYPGNAQGGRLSIQPCRDVPRHRWYLKND